MMSQYESFTQCQNQHGPSIEVMRGYEKSLRPSKTGSLMLWSFFFFPLAVLTLPPQPPFARVRTTLCCGCATRIEWFFAGRFLQGVGESVEPVILASCRDYFNKPEEIHSQRHHHREFNGRICIQPLKFRVQSYACHPLEQ